MVAMRHSGMLIRVANSAVMAILMFVSVVSGRARDASRFDAWPPASDARAQARNTSQTPTPDNSFGDSMAVAKMLQSDMELFMELQFQLTGKGAVKELPFSSEISHRH
jgi:hypothetical protein